MIDDRECPKVYGETKYDLHRVIISTGYYGSCGKCENGLGKYKASTQLSQSHLNERTPLLPVYAPARTWRFINIRIISLGILFIGGVTIGSYLLYEQARPLPIHHLLEFVSREEWNAQSLPTGNRLIPSNVVYILMYQTGNKNCFNLTDCVQLLKHMQRNSFENDKHQQDIPFNFLIGGDGRIFEGRGWLIESGNSPIRKAKVISIAFIGNFTIEPPSARQLSGGLALLEEIEYQRKVASTYSILGIRRLMRSNHDGAALFAQLAKWKRWDQTISIF